MRFNVSKSDLKAYLAPRSITAKLRCMLALLFVLMYTSVSANDGTYYTSGNQLLPLVETDIRVQREVLTLSWGDDGIADVDVYYEFYNPGKGKNVLMGFEADAPDYMSSLDRSGAHPAIMGFTVEVNGEALPVSTSVVNVDTLYVNDGKVLALDLSRYDVDEAHTGSWLYTREGDGVHIAFVYHFDAAFKPGVNIVRHHYRYRMDESVVFNYKLDYKLTPALRWGNRQIDDFTLRIKADSVPLHPDILRSCKKATTQRNTSHIYDNAISEHNFRAKAICRLRRRDMSCAGSVGLHPLYAPQ